MIDDETLLACRIIDAATNLLVLPDMDDDARAQAIAHLERERSRRCYSDDADRYTALIGLLKSFD